jgi:hypothetical protein
VSVREQTDLELTAMEAMTSALHGLDVRTRQRVLRWAKEKFVTDTETDLSEEWRIAMQAQLGALRAHAADLGVAEADLVQAYAVLRKRNADASVDEIAATERELVSPDPRGGTS